MKSLFQKLGFRKMDEMERLIALKAQRNALVYAVLVLLGQSLYGSWRTLSAHVSLNLAPGFVLCSMCLVLMGSQAYYQHKMLAGTQEGREYAGSFRRSLLLGLAVLLALLVAGTWLLLRGRAG